MYLTVALIVLSASIIVFFSSEFAGMYKKVWAIPGVKLIVPLAIASCVIEAYEPFELWLLLKTKAFFHANIQALSAHFSVRLQVVHILQLFLLATLPVWIIRAWEIKKKIPVVRPVTWGIGLTLWVLAAVTLTIYQP